MSIKRQLIVLAAAVVTAFSAKAQLVWDTEHLQEVRQNISQPYYAEAYAALIAEAENILNAEPLSVMSKADTPVSGTKHDYMSLARYYWPDPSKPDGLPYISRDGESNPELALYDRNKLGDTAQRVTTLALAWYFCGDERYAKKAAELIRVWFFNKDTYMNPNLNFAQVRKGHNGNVGNNSGVLDAFSFVEMLDGVQLLEKSKSFTKKDSKQLKLWFSKLTDWMLTSKQGQGENASTNNHGNAYDAQLISFAFYAGRTDLARTTLEQFAQKRIFSQIEPDGTQPHELRRTLALWYSVYNLGFYTDIAMMGKKLGFNLEKEVSADGRSLEKAFTYLLPYVGCKPEQWPYKQINNWDGTQKALCNVLYRAGTYLYPERKDFVAAYQSNRVIDWKSRFNLVHYQATDVDNAFAYVVPQLKYAIEETNKAVRDEKNAAKRRVEPRTIAKDGSLSVVHSHDWTCGFFPGNLWQTYEYTNDPYWRQQAISFTWPIEDAKWHGGTHDLGFMMGCSFGNAYRLTGEQSYRDVVIQASKTLITRYNPTIKAIRSWDHNRDKWEYPVIIDNMMNLEMLFEATRLTGDSVFWNVAVNHANTTMANHFRPDASSYHVVDYSPETGKATKHQTHQGYSDDSFWSRGQGWGLYGYTMCYRYTRDQKYLDMAKRIAKFVLTLPNMPSDGIFYWDMKDPRVASLTSADPDSDCPRDASAAALVASGLYELAKYVSASEAETYNKAADRILSSLNNGYQAPLGTNYGFLLLHCTGHHPAGNEIDVPLVYGDYYYLEALLRSRNK